MLFLYEGNGEDFPGYGLLLRHWWCADFQNAKKLKEAVEYIPMDRIVFETDCPYLAPEPNRGKRNSSLNIPYVIATMAQIKGITEEEVRKAAWDNSLKLYRMDK